MIIYRLETDIDGFGGKLEDQYFDSFEKACRGLAKQPGFFYDEDNDKWDIEMVKEVKVTKHIKNKSLIVQGIPYSEDERGDDPYYINYARGCVSRVYIDDYPLYVPKRDVLYVLCKCPGYNTYINSSINSLNDRPYTGENIYNTFHILARSFSKNYIKKIARTKYKHLARAWNDKEYEEKCSVINGSGEDYLSIKEYELK